MAHSPQTSSVEDRRLLARWAADRAGEVLPLFETSHPGDARVRMAIGQAKAFASGDLDVAGAIRRRGGHAGAAARDAVEPAARAAAHAAEQAAAVAHMGAHALGAAGYAAKALVLAAPASPPDAILTTYAREQVAAMSGEVARALSQLPELGSNRAGPLGPGRLAGGHVGAAIRAIQAELACSEQLHLERHA